jgi:hypothetical protein
MAALAIAFFVCPPTFPDTNDRPKTNVEFEAPVIPESLVTDNREERHVNRTISKKARRLALGPGN